MLIASAIIMTVTGLFIFLAAVIWTRIEGPTDCSKVMSEIESRNYGQPTQRRERRMREECANRTIRNSAG